MEPLVIVSGCPGSGKTTLSAALARRHERGLHLPSDVFYGFPAHPVDPTDPASADQNAVIMRALGRSVGAFLEGGYRVVLDGIVGPWFLPTPCAELPAQARVAYVLLRVPEAVALRRVRQRRDDGPSHRVVPMVRAFADLGALEPHAVDTREGGPEQALARVEEGLAQGRFLLEEAVRSPTGGSA